MRQQHEGDKESGQEDLGVSCRNGRTGAKPQKGYLVGIFFENSNLSPKKIFHLSYGAESIGRIDSAPSWTKKTVTMPLVSLDVGTDVIEGPSVGCQAEQQVEEKLSGRGLVIDERVIQLVIETISQVEAEQRFFGRLDALLLEEKITLIPKRTIRLEMTEKMPLISLKTDRTGRIAILLGHLKHESWCSHTGRLVVYHRGKFFTIHFSSCPTQMVFAPQQQVIVATATGEIFLTLDDEILWTSDSMHNQSVTGLRWVSSQLLLSTALDGRLILSSLKATSLEAIKSVNVTINDLPRSVRRSNSSIKRAGIVAVTGNRNEVFVASETGAVWNLNPDDLSVQPIGADPEGIEQLFSCSSGFVNVTPEGLIKLLHKDGVTIESLDAFTDRPACIRKSLFLFINNGEIIGLDLDLRMVVLRERRDFLAIDIDVNGDLVAIDTNFSISEYQFST
uniref:Uncharacterized protein n=1 Tax=Acrobeloides nanus TaxID=290746 RepID=A0A914CCY2_9BILA